MHGNNGQAAAKSSRLGQLALDHSVLLWQSRSAPRKILFYINSRYTAHMAPSLGCGHFKASRVGDLGMSALTLKYPAKCKQLANEEQMPNQLIYPIIVNWNLATETIPCIESLLTAGAAPGQIVVVDNGSQDDSVAQLTARFGQQIHVIAQPTNLGFAGGNNLGIQWALDAGAQWVLLVNNDTVVAPTFFQDLLAAAAQHPAHQIIGPLILYYGEPNRIWSLGDRLIPGTLITRRLWHDVLMPEALPAFIEVDFLNACCVLIQRTVFEKIGLLNATYFMYGEDVDFCWRARRAGIQLGCATQARIWHKVSRSTGVYHPQARYWRISNQIRVYRQYAQRWQLPLMFGFTLVRSLALAALDLWQKRTMLALQTLRAWRDGWWRNGIGYL